MALDEITPERLKSAVVRLLVRRDSGATDLLHCLNALAGAQRFAAEIPEIGQAFALITRAIVRMADQPEGKQK